MVNKINTVHEKDLDSFEKSSFSNVKNSVHIFENVYVNTPRS